MKKLLLILTSIVFGATSCSTLFWQPMVSIPSSKVVPTDRLNVQLFDAHGMRSSDKKVELVARQEGDSTYVQQILVPKFSEVFWEPNPTNFLWIASTADTSVYQLTYKQLKPQAIPTNIGLITMGVGLLTLSADWGATLGTGAVITIYGGIVDLLSFRAYRRRVKIDRIHGIRRDFKLIDVIPIPYSNLNPIVRSGISAYTDSVHVNSTLEP